VWHAAGRLSTAQISAHLGYDGAMARDRASGRAPGARLLAPVSAGLLGLIALASLVVLGGVGGAAPPSPVIPPGREARVLELLDPIRRHGFLGHDLGDVRIEGPEIRVQLVGGGSGAGCAGGPAWVEPPGGLAITRAAPGERGPGDGGARGVVARGGLGLAWHLCGAGPRDVERARREASALVAQMSPRAADAVWSQAAGSGGARPDVGLLTPVVAATGLSPGWVAVASWLIALVSTVVAGWLAARAAGASRPPEGVAPQAAAPRRPWATAALACVVLALGVAARLHAASSSPPDNDEQWGRSTVCPVFNADHDAWVHPPLFRAVQRARLRAAGLGHGTAAAPILAARLVPLAAGIAALSLLAIAVLAGRAPAWRVLLLVPAAIAPAVVRDSVLARPYALTALLLVVVWWALRAGPGGGPRRGRDEALRWLAALAAGGLAAWTDLVGGIAAVALVCGAALDPAGPRSRGARAAVVLAMLAWVIALGPGGLDAARRQVSPSAPQGQADHPVAPRRGSDPGPDLSPRQGLGRGSSTARLGALLGFAVTGVAVEGAPMIAPGLLVLAALAAGAIRSRRSAGIGLALVVIGLTALGALVSLRTRNVLFLPYLMAFALLDLRLPLTERLGRLRARARALLHPGSGVK
jgi:hypothetical protein